MLGAATVAGCSGTSSVSRSPNPTGTPVAAPATTGGRTRTFPADFVWGAATSAYQVEGAAHEDGRGLSVWDTFARQRGRVRDGSTGDVSADQYHRYRQDVALMRQLGLRAYRFSISWPRVMPTGSGPVNQKGLDYYRRLSDALRAADIAPFPTLWHWDTPQVLEDRGGFTARDTAYRFADYAHVVFEALGDTASAFLTLNEPKTVVQVGYLAGAHAPGLSDPVAAARALHHLLLAHGLSVQAFRASGVRSRIAPVLNLAPCYPADDTEASWSQAVHRDAIENRLYLDPIFRGRYPEDGFDAVDGDTLRAVIRPGDLRIISAPVDLLGVNYYNPVFVDEAGRTVMRYPSALPATWLEIYPDGMYDILTRVHRDYGPRIMVTENGRPTATARAADGSYPDDDRIAYVRDHLVRVHRAMQDGVPIEGYLEWSLLDNFEWAEGYTQRFGMVHVDYATQRRTPKRSAWWFRDLIASRTLVG